MLSRCNCIADIICQSEQILKDSIPVNSPYKYYSSCNTLYIMDLRRPYQLRVAQTDPYISGVSDLFLVSN
jgi:hypothetical protein